MTLDDLDEQIKSTKLIVTPYYPYGTNHNTWLETRNKEDESLKKMKCPTCDKDVTLKVLGGTWHYDCSANQSHHFFRYTPFSGSNNGSVRDYSI